MNPIIANNIAVSHIKQIDTWIDSVIRSISEDLPNGIKYEGYEICTPEEDHAMQTTKSMSRCIFDVAISNIRLFRYNFSYQGRMLTPKYIFLPFVTEGGFIFLGGSRFLISPVLADKVISVGSNNIFIKLIKAKLTFKRLVYYYNANGIRENQPIIHSEIYNEQESYPNKSVKAAHLLAHYLFCKHGFTETFRLYANCTPIVGMEDTINETNYPKDKYTICSSVCADNNIHPRGFNKAMYYPNYIKIAIKNEEYSALVKYLITGFYYIADHFPASIKLNNLDYLPTWRIILGRLIKSDAIPIERLNADMDDHIKSLDEYIDQLIKDKLHHIGYSVNNIYELFVMIMQNFNELTLVSDKNLDRVNTMYDKELSVLYYIAYNIARAFVNLSFKLNNLFNKNPTADISKVEKVFNNIIKPRLIYSIRSKHGGVSTTTSSNDNMAIRITSMLIPQASSSKDKGSAKSDSAIINNPAARLHASIAEVGAFLTMSKAHPDGRSSINPYALCDENGVLYRNPKFIEIIDTTQQLFKR